MEKAHHSRRLPDHPAFRPPRRRHARRLFMQTASMVAVLAIGSLWICTWQRSKVHHLQAQLGELQHQLQTAPLAWAKNNQQYDPRAGLLHISTGVMLAVPIGWEAQTVGTECPPLRGPLHCLGRQVVAPPKNDPAPPVVDVTLYQNPYDTYAKAWFLNTYGANELAGPGSSIEERAVHGRSAASALLKIGTNQDVYYLLSAPGRMAVVHARVFTTGEDNNELRRNQSAVEAIAMGIQFEGQHG